MADDGHGARPRPGVLPPPTSLLGLPRELRDLVYQQLLEYTRAPPKDPDHAGLRDPNHRQPCTTYFEASSPRPALLQLRLCSHQLSAEIGDLLRRSPAALAAPAHLDIMIRGSSIWPTWLSLPLSSRFDPLIDVSLRIFDSASAPITACTPPSPSSPVSTTSSSSLSSSSSPSSAASSSPSSPTSPSSPSSASSLSSSASFYPSYLSSAQRSGASNSPRSVYLPSFSSYCHSSEFSTGAYRALWSLMNHLVFHGPCFAPSSPTKPARTLPSPLKISKLRFAIVLCSSQSGPAVFDDLRAISAREVFERLEKLASDNVGSGNVAAIEAQLGAETRVWRLRQRVGLRA